MASIGYQHTPAFDSGILPVGNIHKLHYEQYGKPDGKPVIFLHGGPGGNTSIESTSFFDPTVYRVVLFDQRGAGKSSPLAETRENTSQHLVADIEALRQHVGVSKWHMVFGGSWGSTLALLYAQAHPEAVGSLVLRGIFTCRQRELEYTYSPNGAAMLYPEEYDAMISSLPEKDRAVPPVGYLKLLQAEDPVVRREAGKKHNAWEMCISRVAGIEKEDLDKLEDDAFSRAHSVLECHYFVNKAFIEEGQLLRKENIAKIRHIPCSIVQGRLDLVCPPRTAWDLHTAWPESKMYMIPVAGHSAKEPGIFKKLVEVCNVYAKLDL